MYRVSNSYLKEVLMKKLYLYLTKDQDSVSWPLLIISFLGGYLLATILFYLFGNVARTSLHGIFI